MNDEDTHVGDEEMEKDGNLILSCGGGSGSSTSQVCCQVENCGAQFTNSKQYYRRHKVCEVHAKAPIVAVAGLWQRFCQQCSRFHEISAFDEAKRSCRRRLAGHNERRRKNPFENQGEGSA
ncbi:squamosa promoter-binding protein 2-like [Impatiens glandulifera]|uniref:squamosa promoter-binding protein 2-like n=1 Tax=Impatiens glandulifera TaxID=253017 RepID=UPI001FB0BF5A|nr:squamosa promoter-binding protein 2-like [Impatiens glandulifera]